MKGLVSTIAIRPHFEASDHVFNQRIRLDAPVEMPSAYVTVAEWTQLCEAIDDIKPSGQYLRLFWSTLLGVTVAGIASTIANFLGDQPHVTWVASLSVAIFAGTMALFGYLVDQRGEDSLGVRVEVARGQIRHIERLHPTLVQRFAHPSE